MRLAAYAAASLIAIGMLQSTAAYAQSDSSVVVMRRSLDPKTRTYAWIPDAWSQCSNSCGAGQQTRAVQCMMNGKHGSPDVNCGPNRPADTQSCYDIQGCDYTWQPGEWTDTSGCGQVVETRDLTCLRGDGKTVPNDQCPTPAPDTSREVRDLRTCSYEWKSDAWSAFSSECKTGAVSTRTVWCERSNGEKVTDAECSASGAKPAATQTEDRYGQCGYSWKEKPWSAWSSSCQTGATRTREVVCLRSNGDEVADAMCGAAGAKPAVSETGDQYGQCSYSWKEQAWGAVAPACGSSSRSRSVQCVRSNGDVVADASCDAGTKPAVSEAVTDYQTCTYSWNPAAWSAPSTTCGSAVSTRSVTCLSSDGRTVPDASCSGTKPDVSKTTYETSGCGYSWDAGAYSAPVPACGPTVQNRSVTCLRSDGQTVADASCPAGTRPAAQQAATDYSTCTYGWTATAWGAWSSSCGSASQTRSVTCQSSDGRTVADSFCAATAKPDATQSSYQTAGCGRTWTTGAWSASDRACSASAVQTRSVTCLRSDGQTVADAECAAAKPTASQTVSDYSGCANYWVPLTGFSDWNSHCSATASRTRSVSCVRNEWHCDPNSAGLLAYHPGLSSDCSRSIPDSSCAAQAMPARSESSAVYDQCGYSRVSPSAWSGWDNACSGTANRTRTYSCQRSDGTIVAAGECTARGISLTETETGANYTNACPGYFVVAGWSDYNSHCSASATRTRAVTCLRSGDNVFGGDQYCTDRGVAVPARSETAAVFDGCGYTWSTGGWGAPAAACGASARYRAVWCTRSDGATVDAGNCNPGTRPPDGEGVTDYSACSYGWAYNGWGTTAQSCGSVSQARSVWCQRSDGATVAEGYCNAGARPAASQTFADYSACGYSWVAYGYPAQQAVCGTASYSRDVACVRSDGARVAEAYCGGGKPPTTENYTNYAACGYSVSGWSGYNYASSCSGNTTATQYATGCRRSDGADVAIAECSNRGIPTSQSVQTANFSGCGYSWQAGGWSGQQAVCTTGTEYRDVWCQRSDGARVDGSLCGGGQPAGAQGYSNVAGCGYTAYYGGFGECQSNGTQTQGMNLCQRSDGASVAGDECVARGQPWTRSQACTYYTYQAFYGAFGACTNGTKTQGMNLCRRSDGASVAGEECVNRGQPWTISQACTLSCSWTAGGPGYGSSGAATSWGSSRMPTSMSTIPWVYYALSNGAVSGGPEYLSNTPNSTNPGTCDVSKNGVYGTIYGLQRYNGGYPSTTGSKNVICSCTG